eukprot:204679-Pelagomonas_calceolata.AAC.2
MFVGGRAGFLSKAQVDPPGCILEFGYWMGLGASLWFACSMCRLGASLWFACSRNKLAVQQRAFQAGAKEISEDLEQQLLTTAAMTKDFGAPLLVTPPRDMLDSKASVDLANRAPCQCTSPAVN